MRLLLSTREREIGVDGGAIVPAEGRFDLVLDLPDAEIRPGLINAHDHLHRNHYGRLGRPLYQSAYQWAEDIQARYRHRIANRRRISRRQALLVGAWKNLFSGVTTVVHHDPWEHAFGSDFPLRVHQTQCADSLGMSPALSSLAPDRVFCLHVAEGVDRAAADEIRTLEARGLLVPTLIAVHCVGIDADGIARLNRAAAACVWCPTSNIFLFGRTAPAALLESGIDVLLGSDSLLTADGGLLDELRFARALEVIDDTRLEQAVGATAARRLGAPLPSLEPGKPADLIVLTAPLLEARTRDVALVMVGGALRVVRPDLVPRLRGMTDNGREMTIDKVVRWTGKSAQIAPDGRMYS